VGKKDIMGGKVRYTKVGKKIIMGGKETYNGWERNI
jgi:hypothetical protein